MANYDYGKGVGELAAVGLYGMGCLIVIVAHLIPLAVLVLAGLWLWRHL